MFLAECFLGSVECFSNHSLIVKPLRCLIFTIDSFRKFCLLCLWRLHVFVWVHVCLCQELHNPQSLEVIFSSSQLFFKSLQVPEDLNILIFSKRMIYVTLSFMILFILSFNFYHWSFIFIVASLSSSCTDGYCNVQVHVQRIKV